MEYAGRITVQDASRARFALHEYRGRKLFKRLRVLVIAETGERVRQRTLNSFVVAATGEPLVLVNG
jgi:hypothetical protein